MCNTPKFLNIKSRFGTPFKIIVPCGHCYDCLNKKRSEFVFRCKTEFDDTRNKGCSSYFVTLKYSDNNLVYWDTLTRRYGTKQELDRISQLPKTEPFKYSNFILVKKHVQDFVRECQKKIKTFAPRLLFRTVIAGEYGCWSHRPHFHLIFFCPIPLQQSAFEKFFLSLWRFGHVDCKPLHEASINYVAKHYVKDDCGSEIQQRVSPRFCYYSRYKGSIGRTLITYQRVVRNFVNGVGYDVSGKYKVPLPRFIRKKLKPNGLTDIELFELSKKSMDNFAEMYYQKTGNSVTQSDYYSDNSLESVVEKNFLDSRAEEFNKKLTHKKEQFAKKCLKLRREGYFDTDNEKHV